MEAWVIKSGDNYLGKGSCGCLFRSNRLVDARLYVTRKNAEQECKKWDNIRGAKVVKVKIEEVTDEV